MARAKPPVRKTGRTTTYSRKSTGSSPNKSASKAGPTAASRPSTSKKPHSDSKSGSGSEPPPPTKAKTKRIAGPGDATPNFALDPAPAGSKDLVLKVIIAKLESSKECDWFALSQKIQGSSYSGATVVGKGKGKGKAEAGKDAGGDGMSGNELRELYHRTILPYLKAGIALWTDEPVPPTPMSFASPGQAQHDSEGEADAEEDMEFDNEEESQVLRKVVTARKPNSKSDMMKGQEIKFTEIRKKAWKADEGDEDQDDTLVDGKSHSEEEDSDGAREDNSDSDFAP